MPSLADLEQWMEEQIPAHLHDLPTKVHATLHAYSAHLYEQLIEITPSMAQLESSLPSIPFVNGHTSHAPELPTSTPTHLSFFDRITTRLDSMTGSRRRTSILVGVGFAGLTYSVASQYVFDSYHKRTRLHNGQNRPPRMLNGTRCDALVILGADTSLGRTLSHAMAAQGYIIMASVATEQGKQSFDALIPPSVRGYIKTFVLPDADMHSEHIAQFVQNVSTARQLRWPLTAAGDPYARPGAEVNIVAIINASSYAPAFDDTNTEYSQATSSTVGSLEVEQLANHLQRRAVIPLATMRALLSSFSTTDASHELQIPYTDNDSVPSSRSWTPSAPLVLSLVHRRGSTDVATQALLAGMRMLACDLTYGAGQHTACPTVVTLETRFNTAANLLTAFWPAALGGRAISSSQWRSPMWPFTSPGRKASIQPFNVSPIDGVGPHKGDHSNVCSDDRQSARSAALRESRRSEYRAVCQAALQLITESAQCPGRLSDTCFVLLDTPASRCSSITSERYVQSTSQFEDTVLFRILRAAVISLGHTCRSIASIPFLRLLPHYRSACYSGTRNPSNSRPAFGPGPGPASNTHSRSCIRPSSRPETSTHRRGRPLSTTSTSSSDQVRSSESESARESVATGSAPVSAPPSNHDMSSSGLLSSVPSSAFGDLSEEEQYVDSDYVEGTDSPLVGGRASTVTHLQTPSSESWQHDPVFPSAADKDVLSSLEDQDDSGTALGSRGLEADDSISDVTPHASCSSSGESIQSGLAGHAVLRDNSPSISRSGEERKDEGQRTLHTRGETGQPDDPLSGSSGMQSPLGQSWVALGSSASKEH